MAFKQREREQVSVKTLFGFPHVPDTVKVKRNKVREPCVPEIDPNFKFRSSVVSDLVGYLVERNTPKRGLLITGPTGSGKSSTPEQVLARLNYPAQEVTAHKRMEYSDVLGHHIIFGGETRFQDGPLTVAATEGHAFILNEADRLDPATAVAFHRILDRQPIVIAEDGGRVVPIHPEFRFIATMNTKGNGSDDGSFASALMQDIAFMDRFECIELDYADRKDELEVLNLAVPNLPTAYKERIMNVCEQIRKRFLSDASDKIEITCSTRAIINWAELMWYHRKLALTKDAAGAPVDVIKHSFARAVNNKACDSTKLALEGILNLEFGSDLNNKLGTI